jgi:hypothetical protein
MKFWLETRKALPHIYQEYLKETPLDFETCVFCARHFVESQLHYEESLYRGVFYVSTIEDKQDAFFCEVLAHHARRLGDKAWTRSLEDWNGMLDNFLHEKHGVGVFNEWLNVPYVQRFLRSGRSVLSQVTNGLGWDSAAHAMAFCNRAEFLNAILSKLPDVKDRKVTCVYIPLSRVKGLKYHPTLDYYIMSRGKMRAVNKMYWENNSSFFR